MSAADWEQLALSRRTSGSDRACGADPASGPGAWFASGKRVQSIASNGRIVVGERGFFGEACVEPTSGQLPGRPRRRAKRIRLILRNQGAHGPRSFSANLRKVARVVEDNALSELGLSSSEPGLMRTYVSQRVPFAEHRLLGHVAALAASGWETGHQCGNEELQRFCSRLLVFAEQAALDSGKLSLAWLLSGYPDPAPQMWQVRRAPGLKPFSRLCAPQWLAANLAYLKVDPSTMPRLAWHR